MSSEIRKRINIIANNIIENLFYYFLYMRVIQPTGVSFSINIDNIKEYISDKKQKQKLAMGWITFLVNFYSACGNQNTGFGKYVIFKIMKCPLVLWGPKLV